MQVKREKLERVCRSVALAVHTGPLRGQPGWGHQTEGKQNCAGPFAMVSGRISQHYLLIWDHFKVVSSAPALPRLAFLAPGRWLAHPPQMGALLCLFLWLRVCSSWSPSFTGVFPRARGRFLWPICASEDDRKPQAQACHQWVSWPREGPVRPVSDGDQEAGVPCSCAVLGREAPILTASVVSILASGPPVTTLILV